VLRAKVARRSSEKSVKRAPDDGITLVSEQQGRRRLA